MTSHHTPIEDVIAPPFSVAGATSYRRVVWAILALVLLAAGSWTSVLAASNLAHRAADNAQSTFQSNADQIADTLKLQLTRAKDLESSAAALFITNPTTSQAQFTQWLKEVAGFPRYPELVGIYEIAIVPHSALAAFEARQVADPAGTLGPHNSFVLTPPGDRPYYCLVSATAARFGQGESPMMDLCQTQGIAPYLLKARDNGQPLYVPYTDGKQQFFIFGSAVYQNGAQPSTVAARQATALGWLGLDIIPEKLLTTALQGYPGDSVALTYASSTPPARFTEGTRPSNAISDSVNLDNGWTVTTYGPRTGATIFANSNALALFGAGLAASLLLSALVYLLGTGRARARAKLEERTDQLRFQALHDALTGLPNRELINDRTEQMMARCRRYDAPLACMFIDLDDFKDVNDTLGHSAGDELLVAVATRLSAAMREGDTVGRLGGDEFILLVEGAPLNAGANVVADRILEVFESPFEITASELPIAVSASIGIATDPNQTADELLRNADIALYRAKGAGGGCAVVFEPVMRDAVHDRSLLMRDLRTVLDARQLFLLYQPTIDLDTNSFTGVEALLRWRHPERGVVQPTEFIPLMESSGLIVPIGAWVLEEACRQGAEWLAKGHNLQVSVNVSAKQLEQERIVDDVRLALATSGFDPSLLILEITETTLMQNPKETVGRLEALKALGIRIAIDDFGTGYSSLSYLKQFPIDVLKIDRSFVSGLADSFEAVALVRALVDLGKILKLETIAEGIEDDDQRLRLRAEKVDTGQGFLFSRPVDAKTIERFVGNAAGSERSHPAPAGQLI